MLCDWSSDGRVGLAPTVRSGCVFESSDSGPPCVSFGLWVSGSCALGSPIGQRSTKSLFSLEVLLVLEL